MAKIKICGLRRPEDIDCVNELKPDWCGFIIGFPKSYRSLTPDRVRELRAGLSPKVVPVGVFVDAPVELPAELLRDGTISVAQLHGHEDGDYIARLRALAPGGEIWKAVKVRTAADLDRARSCAADTVMLDNGYGTGERFDWDLAAGFDRRFILAGGLTPENIGDAVRQLRPWGVDISSGVETDRYKDASKIKAAILAARKE